LSYNLLNLVLKLFWLEHGYFSSVSAKMRRIKELLLNYGHVKVRYRGSGFGETLYKEQVFFKTRSCIFLIASSIVLPLAWIKIV